MSPVICTEECPPGESRDSPDVPRKVCRCPPEEIPLTNFLEHLVSSMDDEGKKEDGNAIVSAPLNCRVVDKVLEGALPTGSNHTLPLMTIVQC
ncbi:unnamed protein product [Hydatigera taeniaeformis]|uniref:Uncharacterized protein n=1 Tax=Hydatigena taeniaeformis TaxID=6205 RepID=A0A0R3XAE0_HYDTA|nr:unnamed protein product [Hydatigera taeniaeformis]